MGPIPFPSAGQLLTILVLAGVGLLAVLGGAVWAVVWLCRHLQWVN